MSARRPRRRWTLLLLLVLIGAGAAWTLLGRGSDPTPARVPLSPACRDIQGEELAVNDRWRVVHTGDGGEFGNDYSPTPVVACDLRVDGPARVRLLGMAKLTGGGEDYVVEDGPYVEGGSIGGDLVLVDSRFYRQLGNEGGSKETGFTTLYDLRRGASTRLPGDWLQRLSYEGDTITDRSLEAHLTPRGGLTTVYSRQDGRKAPTTFGPVTVWDENGRHERPGQVDRVATAPARSGDDGGLFFHTPGGASGRIAPRGAASPAELRVDPNLAWRRMELASEPSEEPEPSDADDFGSPFGFLPADPSGHQGGFEGSLWLRYSPSSRARNRAVTITTEAGTGRTLARLAKGSDDELRTLGSNGDIAIITGRFREQPGERRVRMIGQLAPPSAQRFFDLPATTAFRKHGRALIGAGVYALTDGTRLWLWGPSGGHVFEAPGLRDLTLALGGAGLFATEMSGRTRYFSA